MWIKICGTTNLDDALLAADLGADALGFIFAPSRRRVSTRQVASMAARLPDTVERIGVFTSGEPTEIAAAALEAGLTGVQLHASFAPGFQNTLRELTGGRLDLIPAVHWQIGAPPSSALQMSSQAGGVAAEARSVGEQLRALAAEQHGGAPDPRPGRVLVDSRVGDALGGTGVSFPWKAAAQELTASRDGLRLIVAGGLRAETVAEAIHALSPWGVDVTSGVEREPGKKDPEKLQMFFANARAAMHSLGSQRR